MTKPESEQLLLPLLFPVPAGEEWEPPTRQEVVAERLRVLGLPIKEEEA